MLTGGERGVRLRTYGRRADWAFRSLRGGGRYAVAAPEWKPRMPRLNAALALTLVLMLMGAVPAMAMDTDPRISTEVFVEAGDNPTCWWLSWMSWATCPT